MAFKTTIIEIIKPGNNEKDEKNNICHICNVSCVLMFASSCKKDDNNNNTPAVTVTDIDANVYHIVNIDSQVWMAENLKVTHYRNGDSIPKVTDAQAWSKLTTGAYCDYNNTAANSNTYGSLYNFYTVVDSRNICPTGWHVPSDTEWTILITFLGGSSIAGGKLKETGTLHWQNPNTGATNSSGFTALPGGDRLSDGTFAFMGNLGLWWSSSEFDSSFAYDRDINFNTGNIWSSSNYKGSGFSVRCLKD